MLIIHSNCGGLPSGKSTLQIIHLTALIQLTAFIFSFVHSEFARWAEVLRLRSQEPSFLSERLASPAKLADWWLVRWTPMLALGFVSVEAKSGRREEVCLMLTWVAP